MAPLIVFAVVFVVAMIVLWLLHDYSSYLGNPEPADIWIMVVGAAAAAAIAAGITVVIADTFALVAGIFS
jgi:hypothetical protein